MLTTRNSAGEPGAGGRVDAPRAVGDAARKVLLLSIGLLATAIEEGYDFISRLDEHRARAEAAGRRQVEALQERRKAAGRPGETVPPVESAPIRLSLPTRADIAVLDEQIARLADQIDRLQQA